ncbi:hypothetical protein GO491_06230 [Flavobacteriaceae bacterium Ap0902]|nr:hypothetical protein [Flavobacteriaceae bacterium Ap0902]
MMRENNFLRTLLMTLMAAIMLGFISCSSGDDDMPAPPVEEPKDKNHEDWTKVTFTFHTGHLHGSKFHGSPMNEDVQYYKASQEISFQYDASGNLIKPDTPIRFIKGEYYALEIKYYDNEGQLMNQQFANEINAPIHQHFFITKEAMELDTQNPFTNADNILDYTYRDTDPVDEPLGENGSVLRENDPLGFKGYFSVNEAYTQFDLNVVLVHIINGDKFDENGNPYPFNDPNRAFFATQDLNLRIPVRVYTERPYEDMDQFFEDMANEFNITVEEAENDWQTQVDTPHDSGNYWM